MDAETKSRNGFTFWRSFRDAIAEMPEPDQLPIYKAIADYGLDGTEPDMEALSQFGRVAWRSILPSLRSGWTKSEAGKKARGIPKPGMRGNQNAAKKQSRNKAETKQKQSKEKGERRKEKGEMYVQRSVAPRSPAKRFTPPTVAEVAAYARDAGLRMDAARFVDHFTSNGWRVGGRAPMKDWKSAARNWARNDIGRSPSPSLPSRGAPPAQPPLNLFRDDGEV